MEQIQIKPPDPDQDNKTYFEKVQKAIKDRRKGIDDFDFSSIVQDSEEFLKVFKQPPGE